MLRLREIEIAGFKSFADRTKVLLPGDVIVVVGPNGSGKSNVGDAVLWALGEQSARALRGGKMQDVIFNGTPKRPPAGQSEVTLWFEDDDKTRIQVGRRLTRGGESTYLLNGRACRLKDIHEFCHQHAISVQGTYLVEQGRVTALLQADPEERRLIFEEVAGIAHYKENRRGALQKLEGAQANLLRLTDIMAEVETQMGALKKQASRADRYVRLSNELRDRRRDFFSRAFKELSGKKAMLAKEFDLYRKEREKRETLLATLDAELHQAKLKLNDHESSYTALREAIHQKELDHERREQESKRRTEQILQGRNRVREIEGDLETLASRLREARKEAALSAKRREDMASVEEKARLEAKLANEETEACGLRAKELDETLQALRKEAFEAAQAYAIAQSELKRIEEEFRRLDEREARLKREQESLKERLAQLEESGTEAESLLGQREEASNAATKAREEAEARLNQARAALEQAALAEAAAQARAAAQESRLKVLTEQQASRSTTVEAWLAKNGPKRSAKTLARLLAGAPKSLVPPLSAVLGELLEGLTGEPWEALPETLSGLRKEKAGTAVFWLSDAKARRDAPVDAAKAEGFAGWLHELPNVPDAARNLLPLTAFVKTPDQARAFERAFGIAAVSEDGVYVHPDGWVRGGGGGTGAASLFELEQDLEEATKALKAALAEKEKAAALHQKMKAESASRQDALQQARAAEAAAIEAKASAKGEYEKAESERRRIEEMAGLSVIEIAQAASDRKEWEAEKAATESRLARAKAARENAEAKLHEGEARQGALRLSMDEAHKKAAAAQGKLGEVTERVKACDEALRRDSRRVQEIEETLLRLQREKETLDARHAALQAELTEGDRALRELLLRLEEDNRRKSGFEEQLAAYREEVAAREKQVAEARENLDQARQEAARYELLLTTAEADLKNLKERISELFEESPEALAAAAPDLPPLTDEEREQAHADLLKLEQKISEMGAVNMLAREEYAELEQRYTFLVEQKKDLDQAVANLEETIRKVNRTIRERFMEAFTGVQTHFAQLFKELSEGGEARLSLLDESNPLETGVEVWAQPPGKKLKLLQLLSGGEQAMVALALLFALFRYRPQPFFILDEVDAPLDEANIVRFDRLLQQFRHDTQFVIATHNKRTMELAEVLYGVTMAEGGVSRIVSVRLGEVQNGNGGAKEIQATP